MSFRDLGVDGQIVTHVSGRNTTIPDVDGPLSVLVGTCTPEQFGAVGDNLTDDTAALDAAEAALALGTYHTLMLGSGKAYKRTSGSFTLPQDCSIQGHGINGVNASQLSTTADAPVIIVGGESVWMNGFTVSGSGVGSSQHGISNGDAGVDGSGFSLVQISNVHIVGMGGCGFYYASNPVLTTFFGPLLSNVTVTDCAIGYKFDTRGEYARMSNCQANDNVIGLQIGAGNVAWNGGSLTANGTAVKLVAGVNDGHGEVVGAAITHSYFKAIVVDGVLNGHRFVGCEFIDGTGIWLTSCYGIRFDACRVDSGSYNFDGSIGTVFSGCAFSTAYSNTVNNDVSGNQSSTMWDGCLVGGGIPTWVQAANQIDFTFASDANDTLTKQESEALIVRVQAGVISAPRTITSARLPEKSSRRLVLNLNTVGVTWAWSSGTSVTIRAGSWAVVGSDGTNAILLESTALDAYWTRESTSGRMHIAYRVMTGAPALTFAAAGNTITRASGSWTTDGFAVGDSIAIRNTVSNNFATTVTAVSTSVLTVAATLVNESVTSGNGYIEGGGTLTVGQSGGTQPKMGAIRVLPKICAGAPYYEEVIAAGLIDAGSSYGPSYSVAILAWNQLGDIGIGGTFTASNQSAGCVEHARFIGLWAEELKDFSKSRDWSDDAGTFTSFKQERRAKLQTTNATPTAIGWTLPLTLADDQGGVEVWVAAERSASSDKAVWRFNNGIKTYESKAAGASGWDASTTTITGQASATINWTCYAVSPVYKDRWREIGTTISFLHASANVTSLPDVAGTILTTGDTTASTSNDAKGTATDKNPVNVQTTDATQTVLDTVAIPNNSAIAVSWLVTGIKSDLTKACSFTVALCAKNSSGSTGQIGSTQVTTIGSSDAAYAATADVNSLNTRLLIAGKAGETIRWSAICTALSVIP